MHRFLEWHAREFMTRSVETVSSGVTLRELDSLFDRHDFNAFPVMEGEEIVGLVTKLDFLKAFVFNTKQAVPPYEHLMKRTVGDVMTKDVVHIESEAPLTRVLELMVQLKARSFPVLDNDHKLAGMISREDLMRALERATERETEAA